MNNFPNWVRVCCACLLLICSTTSALAVPAALKPQLLKASDELLQQLRITYPKQQQNQIEVEALLQPNQVRATQISPDGRWIAAIVGTENDWRQLLLLDTKTLEKRQLMQAPTIERIQWAQDSQRLLIQSEQKLSVVDLSKPMAKLIYRLVDSQRVIQLMKYGALISETIKPHHNYQLRYLDFSGSDAVVAQTSNPVTQAQFDPITKQLAVRINDSETMQFSSLTAGEWGEWMSCPANYRCELVDFDFTTQQAVLLTNRFDDKLSLYRLNTMTKEKQLIHQDPKDWVDIGFINNTDQGWLLGYHDAQTRVHATDNKLQKLLDTIHSEVAASYFELDADSAGNTLVITAIDSRYRFPHYYLYRDQEIGLLDISALLGEQQNTFSGNQRLPIHYQASDGRLIHGFVTLPHAVDLAKAPLIANIHGGPWTRIYPGFSSLAQLLAAEGYVVFEPNFRASTGYGRDYMLAANKDFGRGRVHQDIIDGIEYLLAHRIGNRNKLGIMGHSFGGFSTLGALAFDPDYFQAGIATAAPHDIGQALKLMAKNDHLNEGGSLLSIMKERVGDPANEKDMQALYAKSPDAYKQHIIKPLLMQAGARDRKIKVQAMKGYVASLKKLAKPVSFFVDPDVGHAFDSDMMRHASLDLYRAFWAKHLKDESLKVAKQHQDYLNRTAVFVTDAVSHMLNNQPKSE